MISARTVVLSILALSAPPLPISRACDTNQCVMKGGTLSAAIAAELSSKRFE